MKILIVTGMSGAGKSTALHILEDLGYYCMDNLPPQLIGNFVDLVQTSQRSIEKAAIGVDIRGGSFFESIQDTLMDLRKHHADISILFLDSEDDVLIRRYKELRRPHPLDKAGNIYDGIQRERQLLSQVQSIAEETINTSRKTLGQLKESLERRYADDPRSKGFHVVVSSFGFKHGIALDADLVFDVRFLPNPYYDPDMRCRTGQEEIIQGYLRTFEATKEFEQKLYDLIRFLIPQYQKEGKRVLAVAMGCTGGQHRSVALAEFLAEFLRSEGHNVAVQHRDRKYWSE